MLERAWDESWDVGSPQPVMVTITVPAQPPLLSCPVSPWGHASVRTLPLRRQPHAPLPLDPQALLPAFAVSMTPLVWGANFNEED